MPVRLVVDGTSSLRFTFMTGLEWAPVMPNSNFNLVGGVNLDCLSRRFFIPRVSNSFSAAGHIYISEFYTGQTLLQKNLSRENCISMVPKRFRLPIQETS